MSTLSNIKQHLEKTWDNVSEGWQHLFQKATGALTRFDGHADDKDKVAVKRVGWGLLNTDMVNKKDELVVSMEVPGLSPDDFDIELNGDLLSISGTKQYKDERHEGNYHIMECAYGNFKRSFHLPAKVDPQSVEANYNNGVLRLTMSKLSTSDKIAIKVDD